MTPWTHLGRLRPLAMSLASLDVMDRPILYRFQMPSSSKFGWGQKWEKLKAITKLAITEKLCYVPGGVAAGLAQGATQEAATGPGDRRLASLLGWWLANAGGWRRWRPLAMAGVAGGCWRPLAIAAAAGRYYY